MIAVTFQQGWDVYNAGETAGFVDDLAEKLIKAGVAVPAASELPDGVEGVTSVDLASLKLDELKAIAAEKGIDLGEATKKADILDLIEKALAAEAAGA